MVLVEDATRVRDVQDIVAPLAPGQCEQPIDVIAADGRFRRQRRHAAELADFAQSARLHRLGHVLGGNLSLETFDVLAVVLSELTMNRLQLLLQIELALVLEERAPHLVIDLSLQAQELALGAQHFRQHAKQREQRGRLEQGLTSLHAHAQVRGNTEGLPRRAVGSLDERDDLRGNTPVQGDIFFE